MKQSEIIKEINNHLSNYKLRAVKYICDIFTEARRRNPTLGYSSLGLREAKDSIDDVLGYKNPGKKWIENCKVNRPILYKELRYIKII